MDATERQLNRTIALCVVNAASYAAWQGAQLTFVADVPGALVVSGVGAVVWIATLGFILWPLWRNRGASTEQDERLVRNAGRAMVAGYYALIITVATLFGVASVLDLEGIDIARGLAIVGVVSPVLSFAIMEAIDGRS